ncbi:MAG: rhodanese-like domain-containing protein [Microthrixaceae bacterium]
MNRRPLLRVAFASFALLVAASLAAGCSSDDQPAAAAADSSAQGDGGAADSPAPGEEAAKAALEAGRFVVDVRTPEEYDEGHVTDAQLIDIQGPDFDAQIAELDADGEYVVYCRSGNRSAVAAEEMRSIGLDVLDGGGLDDMTAAGWATD